MGRAHDDTICAIATPSGEGGIGIIRLSGPHAIELANRLVRLRRGGTLYTLASQRLQLADIVCPTGASGEMNAAGLPGSSMDLSNPLLETGLVVVMRAPHSYTGEDVVEFQCHSSPVLLRRLCEGLLAQGARLAQPGEFTKRAFLNGRLDLSQAEGVLDTIQARSEQSLRVAHELTRGRLSTEVQRIMERLIGLLAHLEAGIDFVEDDVSFVTSQELRATLDDSLAALNRLLRSWEGGRLMRLGAKVAIVGRPNVGKSSVLNALLETDRAIVTPIPGTTRDVLEESVTIDGLLIRLLDTAGIRDSLDPVEQEGVRRSYQAAGDADLVLVVVDGSEPLAEGDRKILSLTRDQRRLVAINKVDRPNRLTEEELQELSHRIPHTPVPRVSALTGMGFEVLRRAIVRSLPVSLEPLEGAVVTRLRHRDAITRAYEGLQHARSSLDGNLSAEFLAVDLRASVQGLGEVTGAVTTDDILDRIFSEFCIGK